MQTTGLPASAEIAKVEHFYTFRSREGKDAAQEKVKDFLGQHPGITPALLDARDALQEIFPDSPYFLNVRSDPDIDNEQLVLSIAIRRDPNDPRDGVRRLRRLEDGEYLDADRRTQGKLTVVLESRRDELRLG